MKQKTCQIKVQKLRKEAKLPLRAHLGDAGWDLYSCEDATIPARARAIIGTGISMSFPPGHAGLILDRSGLAAKEGITHMAGVMDCGYRGEYRVILYNSTDQAYQVKAGDRIAQLVIVKQPETELVEVDELEETDRGQGRFGSSGK